MIPSKRSHLHVAVATHPGMKGKNNEDRYAVSAYYVDEQKRIPSVFAVVSDGIGGHRAGEVAAEIAVNKISQTIAQSDASQPLATLQEAITAASLAVRNQSDADPSRKGMGATCACAWVIADRLYIASVGDSRVYLVRDGTIHRLTKDHTWIQEALDQGVLTPDQARGHPNIHVIRRYLGSQHPAEADIRLRLSQEESDAQAQANQGLTLVSGDVLVLCSDGLTDLVNDNEIQDALQQKSLENALNDLVKLANERGGHDNITIVSLKMPKARIASSDQATIQIERKKTVPVLLISLAVGGSLLVLSVLGLAGYYFFLRSGPTPTSTVLSTLIPFTFTPSPTITLTESSTGTATPSPSSTIITASTALPSQSITPLSPPIIKVTNTPLPQPTRSLPTYTPWPTNTRRPRNPPTGTAVSPGD